MINSFTETSISDLGLGFFHVKFIREQSLRGKGRPYSVPRYYNEKGKWNKYDRVWPWGSSLQFLWWESWGQRQSPFAWKAFVDYEIKEGRKLCLRCMLCFIWWYLSNFKFLCHLYFLIIKYVFLNGCSYLSLIGNRYVYLSMRFLLHGLSYNVPNIFLEKVFFQPITYMIV